MILLNLQFFAGEKSEKATPKKRDDARKKGQIVKSNELNSAITLLVSAGVLKLTSSFYSARFLANMKQSLTSDLSIRLTEGNFHPLFLNVLWQIFLLTLPMMAAVLVSGVFLQAVETRGLFSIEGLKPDFGRLDPIKGFSRLFSLRSLVELFKSIVKLSIVGFIIYSTLSSQITNLDQLMQMAPVDMLDFVGGLVLSVFWKVGIWLLALGLLDFFYQRFDYEKSLRMTKQEVKDEMKNIEGNPLIKGKIKERQRMLAMRRMMQDVPKADVIITNPTHFAIALKYDANTMQAPQVIAKGIDEVAQRIKQVGRESGVVLVENRPLAQSLYRAVEIGSWVPTELFQAVAEVLAYVYRLKRRV